MTTLATAATPPTSPKAAPPPWAKPMAAVLGTAILLAVLVIAFALPASRSAPHDVPIGVVGTPQQIVAFEKAAQGFDVHIYASEEAARNAITDRDIYGALTLDSPTDVDVLYATAASPAVAAMVQAAGQHIADATHRTAHPTEVRAFPDRDPKGIGLAAGALPLALGGWISAMVIMLLVPGPRARVLASLGVAVVGGLSVVFVLQYVIGTFDGNFWLTSLAGMFGIAATCFTVLGLRELLGGAGIGIAAVLLMLLGNPLSGLASAPELLPQPWGHLGQFLPPGATGTLLRDVSFFDGHAALRPIITLACYLALGVGLYVLALMRARRNDTVDVDRIEFDHTARHPVAPSTAQTAPIAVNGRHRQQPLPRREPPSFRAAGRSSHVPQGSPGFPANSGYPGPTTR